MKKLIIGCLCAICAMTTSCTDSNKENEQLSRIEKKLDRMHREPLYKLYATKNMYNFIKLNTCNGIMTMVQWSTEDGKQFSYDLSRESKLPANDKGTPGRFSLQSTDNIYNFILLDNVTGRTWQVQWNFEEDKRLVIEIE